MLFSGAQQAAPLLGLASRAVGLAAEVTTFEGMNGLLSPSPQAGEGRGEGRFWNRWRTSFVQFGLLKMGGAAAMGRNVFVQHLFQDVSMVAGHQLTARLGFTPAPEGTLVQQFLHAEATNLQLGAGMALAHRLMPGVHALESSLELSLQSRSGEVGEGPGVENSLGEALQTADGTLSELSSASPREPGDSIRDLAQRPVFMTGTPSDRSKSEGRMETTSSGSDPSPERRQVLRPLIEEHLANFAQGIRNSTHRFAKLQALDAQVRRILDRIYESSPESGDVSLRLNRAADQLYRAVGAWSGKVPFPRLSQILDQIEQGLSLVGGSLMAERSVRDFCQEFGSTSRRPPRPTTVDRPLTGWNLRDYQEQMIGNVREDVVNEVSPWLGVASPMQTGKSYLAGPMIRMLQDLLGPRTRFVVLSSARRITTQVREDLLAGFPESEVGRYDGLVKDPQRITVASVYSLARHLVDFDPSVLTVLINDEAFFTQAPIYRAIYEHFGVGEVVSEDGRRVLRPKAGRNLAIGLSGTGNGLEGYHVSGQLGILEAIEAGWIRHMRGEQVMMQFEAEEKENAGERMIWWPATAEAADALVTVYDQHIHGRYPKPKVFAPTIAHTRLLFEAFQRKYGEGFPLMSHSDMEDGDVDASVTAWQNQEGAAPRPLISINQLARGFRGTGIGAVFHTWQRESQEAFAQTTGRGWGQPERGALGELYVLEATWSRRPVFANLARLFGLVDYPRQNFSTRDIREKDEAVKRHRENVQAVRRQISAGQVSALFTKVPLLESWRRFFSERVAQEGGVGEVARKTGISPDRVAGWALGALPLQLSEAQRLENMLGGEAAAREQWVRAWDEVVEEVSGGIQSVEEGLLGQLDSWRRAGGDVSDRAQALDALLRTHFRLEPPKPRRHSSWMQRATAEIRERAGRDVGEEEMRAILAEQTEVFGTRLVDPASLKFFQENVLAETPKSYERLVSDHPDLTFRGSGYYTDGLREVFVRQVLRNRLSSSDVADCPIHLLDLHSSVLKSLHQLGIQTVRDLMTRDCLEIAQLPGIDLAYLKNIRQSVETLGLRLRDPILERLNPPPADLNPDLLLRLNQEVQEIFSSNDTIRHSLVGYGIRFVWQLIQLRPEELLSFKSIGRGHLQTIREKLEGLNLSLGMSFQSMRQDTSQVEQSPLSFEARAILDRPVEDFSMSARVVSALENLKVRYIGELVRLSEVDLLKVSRFGHGSLREVRGLLSRYNLTLSMSVDDWVPPDQRTSSENEVPRPSSAPENRAVPTPAPEGGVSASGSVETTRQDFLDRSIDEIIPQVAYATRKVLGIMRQRDIKTVRDLVLQTEQDIYKNKNLGRKSLNWLKEILRPFGLRFGMTEAELTAWASASQQASPEIALSPLDSTRVTDQNILDRPVEEIIPEVPRVKTRTLTVLEKQGIETVRELVLKTEGEIYRNESLGPKCLDLLKTALRLRGLRLGMTEAELAAWAFPQTPIRQLKLPLDARRALLGQGIQTVGDLLAKDRHEVLATHGIGWADLEKIEEVLQANGFNLKDSLLDRLQPLPDGLDPNLLSTLNRELSEVLSTPRGRLLLDALNRYRLRYVWQIVQFSLYDLCRVARVSRAQVAHLSERLDELGLRLGMNFQELSRWKAETSRNILDRSIQDLPIAVRTIHLLRSLNAHNVGQLVLLTEERLRAHPNFTEMDLQAIRTALSQLSLHLGMSIAPELSHSELNTSIDDLTMSVRASRALMQLNVQYLGEIVRYEEAVLTERFGAAIVEEIRTLLTARGLRLGMSGELRDWTPPSGR